MSHTILHSVIDVECVSNRGHNIIDYKSVLSNSYCSNLLQYIIICVWGRNFRFSQPFRFQTD